MMLSIKRSSLWTGMNEVTDEQVLYKEVLVITKEPLGRFCKCLKESSSILSVMLSRENK